MELKGLTGSDMNKLTVATMQVDALRKQVTDAQATIAALQARVNELCKFRQADHEQLVEVQKYWRESQDEVHELQSQLTQRTAERDTARRRVDELEAREVDVVLLREDLEKRTVELEAANHTASTHQALWREACDQRDKAQAELERVRAERDHAKKMEVVQKEVADNQTWHAQKLRTLIAANKETKHDAI